MKNLIIAALIMLISLSANAQYTSYSVQTGYWSNLQDDWTYEQVKTSYYTFYIYDDYVNIYDNDDDYVLKIYLGKQNKRNWRSGDYIINSWEGIDTDGDDCFFQINKDATGYKKDWYIRIVYPDLDKCYRYNMSSN